MAFNNIIYVLGFRVMVLNATFNNISFIYWQSVLTGVPRKTVDMPKVTDKLDQIMLY